MSGYSLPRPVRILAHRKFFLIPECRSLPPSKGYGPEKWMVAYGLTIGHAKKRLLNRIDPEIFWRGTVKQFHL